MTSNNTFCIWTIFKKVVLQTFQPIHHQHHSFISKAQFSPSKAANIPNNLQTKTHYFFKENTDHQHQDEDDSM